METLSGEGFLAPWYRSDVIKSFLGSFRFTKPRSLMLDSILLDGSGRVSVERGLSTGNVPQNADSTTDWHISLLFPDDEETEELQGTHELLDRCIGVEFSRFGFYDKDDKKPASFIAKPDSNGGWVIESVADEFNDQLSFDEIDSFLVDLVRN